MPRGPTAQSFFFLLTALKTCIGKCSVFQMSLACKKQQGTLMVLEVWIHPGNNCHLV